MGYDDIDDLTEEFATITMLDDDGNEVEFVVISSIENKGINYLLVLESHLIEDDEAEATILKEINDDDNESIYAIVENDDEFHEIVALFKNCNDDYDIEI